MNQFKNSIFIIFGSFCLSFSAVSFLNPNSIITGGGVGIAQLLYALFPSITLGIWIAIVSVPLILIGMSFFGKGFVIRTLFSIALISLFTDLLKEVYLVPASTNETILASIFGGLLVGLGVGFVMLGKASTGGTTILAEIIAAKTRFKTSEILLVIDGLIMFSSIFVYGDVEKALFSVIGVYITSRIIDILLSGKPAQKSVTIVSNNVNELSSKIHKNLGEHGTIVKGMSLNQQASKTLILVIVDISKLQLLKEIINEHDENAFLVVQEASELYGRDY
ncbi:YitT family protein [Halarcobacter sp.]|uniref:YitT family protein n=1 Tax=Halarcobacter sp. TaxID=2321133 RepID=UPI002AA84ECC|nr:YitT family protein [Halarcobacter sp.]